ncbi:hypothetical protein [Winogradskyella sp.]|uniref:hypothetical protein n=1 Tax=Winogradskyella sp. TaxID=1883156 RepID=UPI003BAB12ED
MKTKKKTYVLLVLVIGVWGTIAYKIVTALHPDMPKMQQQEFVVNTNYKVETAVDTFSIRKVNRDPFLGTYMIKASPKKTRVKKQTLLWKPIQYHGIVKNGKNKLFIVSIDGKQHLLKKGQTKDSVKLLNGNAKSITMRYKTSSKTFRLKQKS